MLNHELVRGAYIALLGREPESEAVIDDKLRRHSRLSDLLTEFMESDEFLNRFLAQTAGFARGAALNGRVESRVDDDTKLRLFDRTIRQWTSLGEEEPYWSVLSSPRFKQQSFDDHSSEFWESGRTILATLDRLVAKHKLDPRADTVLELGCGVGRMTRYLAERYQRVIAVDISAGNLAIAQSVVRDAPAQVDWLLLRDPASLRDGPALDAFVSFIVLQHNPPPVQEQMLDDLLARLAPGGLALFQVPVAAPHYHFDSKTYLASDQAHIDMHCLPLARVVQLMAANRIECLDIQLDDWASAFGLSLTFFGRKSASGQGDK